MRVSFEVKEKHFLFMVGILAAVSAVGIATGYGGDDPAIVGHTPGEITGGTFGAGDYVFPDNLDVGGNLDVSGNLDVGGNVTGAFIECPSGFTSVESQGRQLGCIQNTQQAPATCQAAILNCFDDYGGKLPTYNEIYIAFQRFDSSLSDVGTAQEWIDSGHYFWVWYNQNYYACGLIHTSGNSFMPSGSSYTSNIAYRCWIPN
jgi:hypothetical protein